MIDNWRPWSGGEQPVPATQIVKVQFRNGTVDTDYAHKFFWGHEAHRLDIIAYCSEEPRPAEPIHAALDALKDSKPTNPKEAIGVRRVSMSVLPAGVMLEAALGMMEGAAKYGRHNYRAMGVQASVYYDATMGHLMDWWEGEDIDPDSGLSHVTKAIDSLIVMRDAMLQGRFTDNRPPRSKVFKRDFNAKAGEILDKHADKKPHHYTLHDKLED